MSVPEREITILIINIASLLAAGISLLIAFVALGIALWQVRSNRRVSKLEGDIIVLEAFLTVELVGQKDKEVIQKLLELIFAKAAILGSQEILEMKNILKGKYFNKETLK